MHHQERDSARGSSAYDSTLCKEQTALLNRIDALRRSPTTVDPSKAEEIYAIKQKYNQLVEKRATLARSSLSDPMRVLPLDLWPDIIGNIVDGSHYHMEILLDLTSVSKGWYSVLTTLPVIWTRIQLDRFQPDYFEKAMMCIHLSGKCEIDLIIHNLTIEEWKEISSRIVSEGRRVRRLEIIIRNSDYVVTRWVLHDFASLPVLQELSLPTWPSTLSDQQYLEVSITKKMPSIRRIATLGANLRGEIWSPYVTSRVLHPHGAKKEHLEALALLPQLQSLIFWEPFLIPGDRPSQLNHSFESVTSFNYNGTDVFRCLTWIGNNLYLFSTNYSGKGDFNALLVAISRFPCLYELKISISAGSWGNSIQNKHEPVSTRLNNPLKVLNLVASPHDQSTANWEVLFPSFLAACAGLKVLKVQGGFFADFGWNCIRSMTSLQDLTIEMAKFGYFASVPRTMGSLRTVRWTIPPPSLSQLLARLNSRFEPNLYIDEIVSHTSAATPRHVVSGSAFPNITYLVISTESSFIWDLSTLYRLRELEVESRSYRNHFVYWASDIWEAMLMRPYNNPALERITINCDVVEWDILLLMLERRNFLNDPRVVPIKALIFKYDLPYRLLYPLSELLGGRFVERDSNHSFSLDAIGERVWNESITGCMRCLYSFRKCGSLIKYRHARCVIPDPESGQDHCPPHEHLVAEPPLPLDMALWLSGRRERRDAYVRKYTEIARKLSRKFYCDASEHGGMIVTGDILAGAHFAYDGQEGDAEADA